MAHAHLQRWAHSPVLAVAFGGLLLKVYHWYHSRPLWLDEEMLLLNVRDRGYTALAGPLWLDQTAPLGWLALQRMVLQVFGSDDRVIRALPVLFALGMLACAAWIGVRWMKPVGAAVFVLLCGFAQWTLFYALEAKPYAADAFWGLLLPSVAVWAIDDDSRAQGDSRRLLWWWTTAIVGQWMAYGAVFVTPACVCLLLSVTWHRGGWRPALRFALPGTIWLANLSLHYYLVMRHARASAFLADFWASGLRPASAGIAETLQWLGEQARQLASHPGGTSMPLLFWLVAGYGTLACFRRRPALAFLWLAIPVTGATLALLSVVPWKDRLAFWMLPALYGAIAAAADDSVERVGAWWTRNNLPSMAAAVVAILLVWPLCWDIVSHGRDSLRVLGVADNHGFDDRAGLRFLAERRQHGDVLLATHHSLPAVWWYGGISIAHPANGGTQSDGAQIFELAYHAIRSRCGDQQSQTQLQSVLAPATRAIVYLGFDSRIPTGFQELVLDELSGFATLVDYRRAGPEGAAAIFDLRTRPNTDAVDDARMQWYGPHSSPAVRGCVGVSPAGRW